MALDSVGGQTIFDPRCSRSGVDILTRLNGSSSAAVTKLKTGDIITSCESFELTSGTVAAYSTVSIWKSYTDLKPYHLWPIACGAFSSSDDAFTGKLMPTGWYGYNNAQQVPGIYLYSTNCTSSSITISSTSKHSVRAYVTWLKMDACAYYDSEGTLVPIW